MFRKTPFKLLVNRHYNTTSTVDSQEIRQFQKLSSEWWDEYGPMKALHSMNKIRMQLIRTGLVNAGTLSEPESKLPNSLTGLSFLDIGCGGGILSEPLSKLGAEVTGVDANPDIIKIAQKHSQGNHLNINYLCTSIEEHSNTNGEKYDIVVASEILEHVSEKQTFINSCVKCLKPSGSIFITTLNKTFLSQLVAIQLAENIGLLPKGTHQHSKFCQPHKLQNILADNGMKTVLVHGITWNVFTNTWHWCSNTSINYALHAIKTA